MAYDYPILLEKALPAPPKRFLGIIPSRRDLAELPVATPGTVLVFHNGGNWERARGRLTGTEPYVVDALCVSVVQTRSRDIEVYLKIPSASAADDFTILARFTCRVTSPEVIAAHGPLDVPKILGNFLRKDRGLLTKGQETPIEEVHQIRVKVHARVRAYCDETSPDIPGLDVALSSVEVLTPGDFRRHRTAMRDAVWSRELAELLAQHEDADVRRLGVIFAQPESAAALGVVRGQLDVGNLAARLYADRHTKDTNILELLKLLEKNGQLDRLPINGQALVNTLMERLTGVDTGNGGPALPGADGAISIDTDTLKSIDSGAGRDDEKGDRFVVNNHSD
jgi:hypothetical protein